MQRNCSRNYYKLSVLQNKVNFVYCSGLILKSTVQKLIYVCMHRHIDYDYSEDKNVGIEGLSQIL